MARTSLSALALPILMLLPPLLDEAADTARAQVEQALTATGIEVADLAEGDLERLVTAQVVLNDAASTVPERIDARFTLLKVMNSARGATLPDDVTLLMAEAMVTKDPKKIAALAERGILIGNAPTAGEAPPPLEPVQAPLGPVVRYGHGPIPLVLVPSFLQDASVFEDFLEANAERFTMWAVTAPGFGGSAAPPLPEDAHLWTPIWLDNLERAIAELVEREGIDRPVVAAHGLFVYTAVHLAGTRPDLCRGAVALDGLPFAQLTGSRVLPLDQRRALVDGPIAGRYRAMDDAAWRRSSLGYCSLSSLPEPRRKAVRESAEAVARGVGERYFLEINAVDPTPEILAAKVPVLAFAAVDWIADAWTELARCEHVVLERTEAEGSALIEPRASELGRRIAAHFAASEPAPATREEPEPGRH